MIGTDIEMDRKRIGDQKYETFRIIIIIIIINLSYIY